MKLLLGPLALLALSHPAHGSSFDDPRFHTFDYAQGGIFKLSTSVGTSQLVVFARGERIQSVTLSDPSAYSVDISGSGDSLTLRASGTPGPTMMSVVTQQRSYELALLPAQTGTVPQVVDFSYSAGESGQDRQAPVQADNTTWRMSGKKALRPASISDDGEKTYIVWGEKQPMPAVFAIGVTGDEEMVEGYVRAGLFTIDRVYDRLVFRIDKQSAKARRIVERKRRKND